VRWQDVQGVFLTHLHSDHEDLMVIDVGATIDIHALSSGSVSH
jgi:hypothetical protein